MHGIARKILNKFPRLSQFLRHSRDLLDRRSPQKSTPWGFTIAGHDDMATGVFEPNETTLVRKILPEFDVFVNVGANIGYYCCQALSMGKFVIAIEPNQRNLYYLLENIRSNGWSRQVEVFPVAVGSCTEILRMWGTGTGASLIKGWASIPEHYVTNVPVLKLDRILDDALGDKRVLILVDVEGAEHMLLEGARKTLLRRPRPTWIMEVTQSQHQPSGVAINPHLYMIFSTFLDLGYRCFSVGDVEEEITLTRVKSVVDGVASLPAHNFVFK